ncbi:hypothetical protein C8F01DRAFT_1100308 [Mycena amicta]|nr:hypothetical protein C8F01DRAFT_1100308 [Mycena amicta]
MNVFRIARLVSDVVIDVRSLDHAAPHFPNLVPIAVNADPSAAVLLHARNSTLVSVTAVATQKLAANLVLHLAELADAPVVLHLAAIDLSDALLLRPAAPYFLLSASSQQAHDNALLSSRLARMDRKLVIHVYNAAVSESTTEQIPEEKALPFVVTPAANGLPNGHLAVDGQSKDGAVSQLYKAYEAAALATLSLVRRPLRPLITRGAPNPHTVVFLLGLQDLPFTVDGVSFVFTTLLTPLPPSRILNAIPDSVSRVIVLEQINHWSVKWTPMYLDVVGALQERDIHRRPVVQTVLQKFLRYAASVEPPVPLQLGELRSAPKTSSLPPHVPKQEQSYTKILSRLFDERLEISNSPHLASEGDIATSPEFALGKVRGQLEQRGELVRAVQELLQSRTLGDAIIKSLEHTAVVHPAAVVIMALRRRKHDVGLYAMNHGDVYVASVLQSLIEADRFDGPSLVLAYLPYQNESASALEVLKETKVAVDTGVLALPFSLDSDAIKNDLQQFLDRQNHLSQLVRSKPQMASELAQQSYNELLTALDAPPLLVLYASDGGAAEKLAKRLVNRGKARGLSVTIGTLDSISVEGLAQEQYVAFLNAAVSRGDRTLTNLRYSVFGMGDSHYWPHGPQTGYKIWEPLLWKALGVDAIEVTEAEPEPITNEHIKAASRYLRGTILEGLEDTSTGALAPSDGQLTKFHGIYQQDDRDIRDERQAQGVEPAYSFMIRVRMPGGVCKPSQWLQMDQIADEHGCGTFKITTRQTFQFHGVIKRHLKPAIQEINRVLLDTLAACGDVNRNVTCSSIPTLSKLHEQVHQFATSVSEHLIPRTTAYHEIWLDKKLVAGEALKDFEPMYGEFYLPRKFKIAVAVPPSNDTDVFANDLGFIAIVDDKGQLTGFNVTIGGGMGVTHGNKKTYPRIGDIIGFCTVEQGKYVAEKVMLNARLKYTIDRMGLDVYKAEVEKLLGYSLAPARPFTFDKNTDDFGWHVGEDGKHHFMLFIENGRVQDEPKCNFKTGLRQIAKVHKGNFRLTTNQHICVSDIAPEDVPQIKQLLAEYRLDNLEYSGLRLASSACVAFPTCGLAMAESERYLPILIDKVEAICEENGLRNDEIVMRMTGCPNGCARPYVAEVAFVGKAPGTYLMLLGGGYYGQRMNKIYRETVTEREILAILRPMIKRYALERLPGERFGDFTIRAGYISPTVSGMEWYTGMGGEGDHKEISA